MEKTSSAERWQALKQEALAIIAVAGSLTAALFIKRLVERLTTSRVIDANVLKHGLAPTPASTTLSSTQPTQQERDLPGFRASHTSSWYNSLQRQHRTGPGRVWVDGVGSILYRAKVQTSDGYTLYEHDTELNPFHITPCPLLRADENCDRCEWCIGDG